MRVLKASVSVELWLSLARILLVLEFAEGESETTVRPASECELQPAGAPLGPSVFKFNCSKRSSGDTLPPRPSFLPANLLQLSVFVIADSLVVVDFLSSSSSWSLRITLNNSPPHQSQLSLCHSSEIIITSEPVFHATVSFYF